MFEAPLHLVGKLSSALAKKIDRTAPELTDREIRIFADHLVDTIKGHETRVQKIEAEKSSLKNNLAAANSKLIQLEAGIEKLTAGKAELEKQRDRECAARVAAQTRVQIIQEAKDSLEKQRDDAKAEHSQESAARAAAQNHVKDLRGSVNRLNDYKTNTKTDINNLRKTISELEPLRSENAGLHGELNKCRRERDVLQDEIDQENRELQTLRNRPAASESRMSEEELYPAGTEETTDSFIGGGPLSDAWRLLNGREPIYASYAFVEAIRVLEDGLRQVLEVHRPDPDSNQSPDLYGLLQMAAEGGCISPDQRDQLDNMRERRNQIVHGVFRLEESQARQDVNDLSQVIDQLGL